MLRSNLVSRVRYYGYRLPRR